VEKFEKEFAAYCGSKYAISCVNGSVSLRLALIASGVRPGDEVIVSTLFLYRDCLNCNRV